VTFTKSSLFFSFLFSSFLAKRRQRISAKNGHKTHQVLYSEKECSRSGAGAMHGSREKAAARER
jgi:hypothetical protein